MSVQESRSKESLRDLPGPSPESILPYSTSPPWCMLGIRETGLSAICNWNTYSAFQSLLTTARTVDNASGTYLQSHLPSWPYWPTHQHFPGPKSQRRDYPKSGTLWGSGQRRADQHLLRCPMGCISSMKPCATWCHYSRIQK